ncbi:unnamed protein product [Owenia fusiformis]|uniref:Uncharacterized protein n=1 Tax=Owenia fusiformis TaxID=6347 RepID=A0A8J1XX12_OWEFU|nr:unnamed protein product [Owenia fusiformis]
MATILGIDHKIIAASTLGLTAGAAAISAYLCYRQSASRKKQNIYETEKSLSEYLVFHYAAPKEILKYEHGPWSSVDFPRRCAELCMEYFEAKEGVPNTALDIGCAVGRSSFELARSFNRVIGSDYSQSFIDACNHLKQGGKLEYKMLEEGELYTNHVASVPSGIETDRLTFQQGDACRLPLDIGHFGCVLAANLICRLHTPVDFLNRLSSLVSPGGIAVITSPYTFLEEYTPRRHWIGSYTDANGKRVTGFDGLKRHLGKDFDLIGEKDMPFFIRETARKNQWTVAHATVWRRKVD